MSSPVLLYLQYWKEIKITKIKLVFFNLRKTRTKNLKHVYNKYAQFDKFSSSKKKVIKKTDSVLKLKVISTKKKRQALLGK